jgi:putative hydrolases of HD superfamily
MKRNLEFLYEIGSLRHLQRTWVQFLTPNFANITEHTFRVMWLALIIANGEDVKNHEKIMKMALVHDITESRAADVHYLKRQYVDNNESLAIEDMFQDTNLAGEFIDVWKEYEKRKCLEAKIVKDADNIDVNLELKEQEATGNILYNTWKEMRDENVYNRLFTKSAREIWQQITDSNPHDWHLKGRNRHLAGDWKNND